MMAKKNRVLHLLTGLTSGGVQNVVLNYAAAVRQHDVVFDYAVQKTGNCEIEEKCKQEGSRIFQLPEMHKKPIAFAMQLLKLLRQHPEYRVFHVHQNDLNTFSLLVAKLAGVPVRISHSHSSRPNTFWKKMIKRVNHRLLCLMATEQWACSEIAFQWLYDRKYQGKRNEHILHNAINGKRFQHSVEKRESLRKQMKLGENFVCISVATLSQNKNQKLLIDVIAYLCHKANAKDIRLVLVGDGPIKQKLVQYAANQRVSELVFFLGDRRDVHDLLNAADCFLLPSMFEGLPVSVIEAQANGLPCVLSCGVPKEAKIAEDVFFEELGENEVSRWAERILELRNKPVKQREETYRLLKESRFLLDVEGEKLAAKYKELFLK